ncbi:MAG: acriflavin resistance protein [Candidatus Binatia bacterium]|nr:MAG: acriflavin resistance protein [Candidatus Binatia bacterium]
MRAVLAWFARNHVAANLLMLVIAAGGILTLPRIRMEVFPDIDLDLITIGVVYPGAAPAEVEEALCIRIEEKIQGVGGVRRITSSAAEGACGVTVELEPGTDVRRALDEIKAKVDAIDTFPEDAEEPVIQQLVVRRPVIDVAVWGDADEKTLKKVAQEVRDDLAALPEITDVEIANARPYEISIEVSETALRRHSLTFDDVVRAAARGSLDTPGGSVKTQAGEILLRTEGQAYRGEEFARIPLLVRPDGTRVEIGHVAKVVDDFAEVDQWSRFDGKPALVVQVFRVGEQNALEITRAVKDYVAQARGRLPEGIELTPWLDESRVLRDRLETLLRNGQQGFLLVLAVLALFLRFRLAFWVILGVPLSFLGALWLMPSLGQSINVVSLFAFILVLGILVDDAIVVGENIHAETEKGRERLDAAIAGVHGVFVPVTFGVLTTVAAFLPMLVLPGPMGKVFRVIPIVVISALIFSLLESQLVLPAHLGHGRSPDETKPPRLPWVPWWRRIREGVSAGLVRFVDRVYRPLLERALEWRYTTVAAGLAAVIVTAGAVAAGWLEFRFFPKVEGDNVVALLTLAQGAPVEATEAAARRIEEAARQVLAEIEKETGSPQHRHMLASVGSQPYRMRRARSEQSAVAALSASNKAEVNIELLPAEERRVSSEEIARRWRERVGAIPGAVELLFSSTLFGSGEPIYVELQGPDLDELRAIATELKEELARYPGVIDIADSFRSGKQELEIFLRPDAEPAGLSVAELGRQVRQAFYGAEVQKIQRERDEVRVMVRYPREHRRSLADVEEMWVRTQDGAEIPFRSVATVRLDRGFSTIRRADRQRVIDVTADVEETVANANEVATDLRRRVLPELLADHPRVSYRFEGEQRYQAETLVSLGRGFLLALFLIYALLAIPLGSYLQPFLIMSAIPFGFVGAVWGHLIMGRDLSIFSAIGMVALSGVVVNDSLVLVDFVNRNVASGIPLERAIRDAGAARFRPILLTSATTFAGLTPLLLERSLQAQFLIPMAISLAFGVVFATFVSLLLVPCSYLILEDLRALFSARPTHAPEAAQVSAPG